MDKTERADSSPVAEKPQLTSINAVDPQAAISPDPAQGSIAPFWPSITGDYCPREGGGSSSNLHSQSRGHYRQQTGADLRFRQEVVG